MIAPSAVWNRIPLLQRLDHRAGPLLTVPQQGLRPDPVGDVHRVADDVPFAFRRGDQLVPIEPEALLAVALAQPEQPMIGPLGPDALEIGVEEVSDGAGQPVPDVSADELVRLKSELVGSGRTGVEHLAAKVVAADEALADLHQFPVLEVVLDGTARHGRRSHGTSGTRTVTALARNRSEGCLTRQARGERRGAEPPTELGARNPLPQLPLTA